MSTIEVRTTAVSWLKNRTKGELISIILANFDNISLFADEKYPLTLAVVERATEQQAATIRQQAARIAELEQALKACVPYLDEAPQCCCGSNMNDPCVCDHPVRFSYWRTACAAIRSAMEEKHGEQYKMYSNEAKHGE